MLLECGLSLLSSGKSWQIPAFSFRASRQTILLVFKATVEPDAAGPLTAGEGGQGDSSDSVPERYSQPNQEQQKPH